MDYKKLTLGQYIKIIPLNITAKIIALKEIDSKIYIMTDKVQEFLLANEENFGSSEECQLINDCEDLIKNSEQTRKDQEALNKAIEFALNEWQTNQHWFREEPGRVTVPDVIRQCVQFGWASKNVFNYQNK